MQPQKSPTEGRSSFLFRNLLKGLAWLAFLVIGYILARKYFGFDLKTLLGPLYENATAIFTLFFLSEVIFGIIPPEFFMFWAIRHENVQFYIENVALLSLISYCSGVIGYLIGAYLNTTRVYRLIRKNYLGKYQEHFNHYGGFLITVAALTPLPFSGVCMLVGSVKYNFRRFLWVSLIRFLRFAVYGWIIWNSLAV